MACATDLDVRMIAAEHRNERFKQLSNGSELKPRTGLTISAFKEDSAGGPFTRCVRVACVCCLRVLLGSLQHKFRIGKKSLRPFGSSQFRPASHCTPLKKRQKFKNKPDPNRSRAKSQLTHRSSPLDELTASSSAWTSRSSAHPVGLLFRLV